MHYLFMPRFFKSHLPGNPAIIRLSRKIILLLGLVGLLIGFPWVQSPLAAPLAVNQDATGLTLLAAGDLRGEIKPCGCSADGQQGGLPRRLSYLENIRKGGANLILVDLGNNFPPPSPQGDLKIELIQTLLKRFPPDAILPGPNELALGTDRLDKKLPYLVSNDGVGKVFQNLKTIQRAGGPIVILGYISPHQVYQKSQSKFSLKAVDKTLFKSWRELMAAEKASLAILLFRGTDDELAAIQKEGMFELIIAGNPFDDEMNQVVERKINGMNFPQVPTKGQGFLRIGISGEKTPPALDWLTEKYPDHPDATARFKIYDEQVKKLFFARMETMELQSKESPYAGVAVCKTCHAPHHAIWEKTRHAGAWKTLEKVGKQFDPECLACHVAGLDQGGYISQEFTPNLAGVQCENCHGPGKEHLANPVKKPSGFRPPGLKSEGTKPQAATCRTCHIGSHSPKFSFDSYWPKIKHQGRP